jgi:hypothetical protein
LAAHLAIGGPWFDLTGEGNIPTFYSTGKLALAGWWLWRLAAGEWRRQWGMAGLGLAGLVFYAAADELGQFHERVSESWGNWLTLPGLTEARFSWLFIYLPVFLLAGWWGLRLWRTTEIAVYRRAVMISAVLYGVAVGLEWVESLSQGSGWLGWWVTLEECSELLAITAFLIGLSALSPHRPTPGTATARLAQGNEFHLSLRESEESSPAVHGGGDLHDRSGT